MKNKKCSSKIVLRKSDIYEVEKNENENIEDQ